jgi:hypothetical protein
LPLGRTAHPAELRPDADEGPARSVPSAVASAWGARLRRSAKDVVPCDVEKIESLAGDPVMFTDDSDRIIDAQHVDDTRRRAGRTVIEAPKPTADRRADQERRGPHPGYHRIDSELGGAVDLGRRIHPLEWLADQLELRRRLERDRRRVGCRRASLRSP